MAAFDKHKGAKGKWKARVWINGTAHFLGYTTDYYPALILEYNFLNEHCPNPSSCLHDYCHLKRSTGQTHAELLRQLGD